MNNKLFVDRSIEPSISVLAADTLALLYNLTMVGLRCISDIASCLDCDEIYISDQCGNKIFVVGEHAVKSQWPVPDSPHGISVNSRRHLIVTFHEARKLREYLPGGQMTKEIRLPSDMIYPQHAVQLSDDQYAVVHGKWTGSGLHRLCIVNGEGTLLKSFGSSTGSGSNQLNWPPRLASFGGTLIVSDRNNDRLMLFDAINLSVTGQLTVRDDRSGNGPSRMTTNRDCSGIYVGLGNSLHKIAFDWA